MANEIDIQNAISLLHHAGYKVKKRKEYTKVWEIMSFLIIEHQEIIDVCKFGAEPAEYYLKYPSTYSIYRVKRLKDSAVFKIADKIDMGDNSTPNKICSFQIRYSGTQMWLSTSNEKSYGVCLTAAKRINDTPILTTTDGIDVYEGDSVWTLRDDWGIHEYPNVNKLSYKAAWKYFSTREKAQEYIDQMQPKYSLMDIRAAVSKRDFIGTEFLIQQLKNIH